MIVKSSYVAKVTGFLLAGAIVFAPSPTEATDVSGYQWGTWSLSGSPYVLTGTVTVPKSEPLSDTNGDGVWTDEEPYDDYGADGIPYTGDWGEDNGCYTPGEPYIDRNDNGEWDPAESFTDLDGSGSWTEHMPALTINPGVEVHSSGSNRDIRVYGQMNANGATFLGAYLYLNAYDGGSLNLTNCTQEDAHLIFHNGGYGTIDNCELTYISLTGGTPTVTGCTFTNIYPMQLSDPDNVDGLAGFSGNTYPQNAKIYIYGQVDGAVTLSSVDGLVGYLLWSYLTVVDGALLTINPGVEIHSAGSSGEIRVHGQMNADGATFIGGYTDIIAYDGCTVNLTGCTQESAYLQCNSGSNVTVSNCELVYVSLTGGVPTVTGCTFTNIYPMHLSDPDNVGGLAGFSGNTYPQNAKIYIYGQVDNAVALSTVDGLVGYLLWSYLTVADGASLTINPGVEIHSTGSSGEFRVHGQMNADGVTFIGGYTDIIAYDGCTVNLTGCTQESAYLQCNSGSNVTVSNCELVYVSLTGGVPTVTGCTFTNIYPMQLSDPDNVDGLAGFSGNTYPQNAKIYIYGQVDNAVALSTVDGLVGYLLWSYLTVADGASLTINPGVEIHSTGSSGEIRVYGQMYADGATFIGGYTDIIAYDGCTVNLTGCTQESAYLQCNSGSNVTVSNCELVYVSLTGGVPTVTGCTFTNIYPMRLSDPENVGGLAGFSGNTYPQNAKIYIYGQVDGAVTLSSVDGLVGYLLWSYLTVADGALLTINPGIEIYSTGSSGEFRVYGQMNADGATFIGGYTDIIAYDGGMVNLTGCIQESAYLQCNSGSNVTASNCELVYVSLTGGVPTVTGCTFTNIYPMHLSDPDNVGGLAGFSGNTYPQNAKIYIYGQVDGAVTLSSVDGLVGYLLVSYLTVADGALLTINPGIEIYSTGSSGEFRVYGQMNADGATFIGGYTDIIAYDGGMVNLTGCIQESAYLQCNSGSDVTASNCELVYISLTGGVPTVTGCTFTNIYPMHLSDPDNVGGLAGFSGNTYPQNAKIYIYGQVDGTVMLSSVDGLVGYLLWSYLTVAEGALLTINPGVEIHSAGSSGEIRVYGQMYADGATFIGGYTDIVAYDGCMVNLTNCVQDGGSVRFNTGGGGALGCNQLKSVVIYSGANPLIANNDFSQGSVSVNGDSGVWIDLENNWWGTTDPGQIEAKITDCNDNPDLPCVDYVPFLDDVPTGCEPPEPPSGEQIHVGQLTITGEVVTQINGSLWQISGNAWINDLLRLTGSVTANTATLTVNGNGQIWLDNVTGLGNVKLYEGPWEFDGQAAATTTINTVLSGLEVVGLDVEVYSVSIQPNGVRLQGHLLMPDLLNEARLEISGSDYILVTRTGRLEWSGAAITIPDAEGLAFMGMPFNVSSVMLHVSPDELQVRGTLELPALLGGTTIDLSTDQNHLSITEAAGQPQVDIVGSLMMDGPIVIGPGFSLADMVFTLDTVQEILQGDGTLNVPAGYGIVAGIGFRQGYFNYIHAGVTNMGIIIVTGPPPALVPIVYWQDVEAWMDELAPGPPPIVFGGAMAFTAGPQIESYYLARLNLTAEYDTGGRFTGTGQVLLGGGDDPFEFASAVVILDKTYGMHVTGHMSYVGVLDVDGSLRIDLYNNMQGKFVGTIHVPAWMGGVDLADATLYGQYYDDSDDTNDYFIAAVRMLFGFESAVKFDIHTGEVDWHADMGLIVEVDVPPGGRGSLPVAFDLPAGLEGALFRAEWDTGDTDLHLIRPGSTLITPDNVDDFADVKYFKDAGTNGLQAMYAVAQPEVGQWQVDLTNSNGIGGYRIQQFNTTDRPVITLLEPSADTSQTTVAITWADADSDSDAVISLYYDTDRQGAGGTEIVTGISEDASTNSFVWDTTGVPAGAYYVHARIDDGQNTPAVDYSIGRVVVTDPAAPGAPTGLAAVAGETSGEIRLAWAAGSGAVDHYVVGVTTDPAGERYETLSAGSQETDTTLTGLVPGRRYRLAVAAVDADDRKSGFSEPIIVTLTDAMNNLPVFVGGIATRATVGQLYQSQVLATDLDGHTISYDLAGEPAGMTVSGSGLVEWAPTADQIGDHTFEVLLDDGHAGSNGLAFTINVADTGGPNRPPEILSHAPVPAQPGAQYGYQLVVDDPEAGDGRFHDLLVAPAGASVSGSGLIQCDVPGGSGRYDFLVRVRDDHGLYDLQRFTIQADADVPTINASDWGTAASPASDTIAIEADPVPDATGLIELQLEVDGTPGAWQLASTWATSGLSANTQHFFRLKARDASADRNESGWSGVLSAYTLADVPPVPSLVLAQETALSIGLDPGTNPAGTQLALWNVSHGEWIALDGAGSAVEVWADAATWGTVTIQSLTVDTTYHFQSKAGNEEGIETGLSEVLAAETLAPPSDALIDASTNAIYENINGLTDQQVVLTASFADDPYANSSYSYTWLAPVHPVTGKELVLVSAGGADDATAVYAAPQSPSGDLVPYEARCVITGVETGNYVMGTVQVSVAQRGDADRDGDVDLADYAMFPAHLLGPGGGLNPGGEVFDFDGDADVDLVDFAVFQMVLVEFHSSRSPLGSR